MIPKTVLAEYFGVKPAFIDVLILKGLPIAGKNGTRSLFNLEECTDWFEKYKEENEEPEEESVDSDDELYKAKLEKIHAEIERIRFRLSVEKGEYVAKDEIEKELTSAFLKVKTRLLSIPGKLATEIVGVQDPNVISKLLSREIHSSLEFLSEGKFIDETND